MAHALLVSVFARTQAGEFILSAPCHPFSIPVFFLGQLLLLNPGGVPESQPGLAGFAPTAPASSSQPQGKVQTPFPISTFEVEDLWKLEC